MYAVNRILRCFPIAFLLIGTAGCENHAIPNKVDKDEQSPVETYESSAPVGSVDADPDTQAEFPGGSIAMKRWLAENISYPQTAVEQGLEGRAFVQFIVDTQGNIRNVRVVRGVPDCPECDQEAVRAIRSMPRWRPGMNNRKPVNSTFNLPISFKLQ